MRDLARSIAEQVEMAPSSSLHLVVVTGPPGSGKTRAFQELRDAMGWRLLNLNRDLSERLLELTRQERKLGAATIVRDLVASQGDNSVTMLDNIGLLFHPSLCQEPLKTLRAASRNQIIIVAWLGEFNAGKLIYGTPDHPEYRRLDVKDVQIVTTDGHCLAGA